MSNKKSSVIGRAKLTNQTHKNAFDLSHRNLFSTSVGVLMPVNVTETLPGEKFSVSNSHFTRAQTLLSNSYGRFIETVQTFYVPFSSIYREYAMRVLPTTQKNISDYNENRISSGISSVPRVLNTKLPSISQNQIVRVLLWYSFFEYSVVRALASAVTGSLTIPPIVNCGLPRSVSVARHLMSLGYGDYRFCIDPSNRVSEIKNYDGNTIPLNIVFNTQLYGKITATNYNVMDINYLKNEGLNLLNSASYLLSPMRLLAYHKVYNDFYRNDVWQAYSAKTCNIDYLCGESVPTVEIPSSSLYASNESFINALIQTSSNPYTSLSQLEDDYLKLFDSTKFNAQIFFEGLNLLDERPLNLPLDAVNGVLPSPQYGSAAKVTLNRVKLDGDTKYQQNAFLARIADSEVSSNQQLDGRLGISSNNATPSNIAPAHMDFDVKDLRIAESLQKFKEISAANENYFVNQITAHFGADYVKDPFVTKFLGGNSTVIQVDTQVNQNLGDDNNAVLGGIASATGEYHCNGVSDDYGIVITLHGIYPIIDYPNIGICSQVQCVDGSDIPLPEFDNNGFEGRRLINVLGQNTALYDGKTTPTSVYGYTSRFFDYKTAMDVANGSFLFGLKDKLMGYNNLEDNSIDLIQRTLYSSPRIADSFFANQNHSSVDDDQFYTNMNCGFSIIRPFSVHSLPYAN